ncbi:hypothetical protein A2865_01020 [Candidatus Woesebacteria bacterium RIFCSPHIGHO2_01_FULL_39_17]|nr:MAG: hypothetical protein A2865_01020 [Candidatus Woesebacteria bacterium RIFCSPHIGHO2_01_FULL_39_17]OGM61250.1 MAG: hypothetical protein A3A52_00470 [Candidatus Woesebacteria bacterium RIFCSPLOWO2_01_FULL_39_14]
MTQESEIYIGISEKELAASKAEFELELEGELTAPYTEMYLGQLYAAIGEVNSPAEFIRKGEELHHKIAHDVYGPLILGCAQFMGQYLSSAGIEGNVYYALRDAKPLMTAAVHVMPSFGLNPVGIYINRPLCGIGDEINPEVVPNGDMTAMTKKYLGQNGALGQEKVGWVDAGCWGTVPLVLKMHHFQAKDYYPVFFYSHNPEVPDYLHQLSGGTGVSEEALNCMNDSLECLFPSPVRRPLLLVEQCGQVVPKLKPSSVLSQKWGEAALGGIAQYAQEKSGQGITFTEQQDALETFLAKIEQSKQGIWSGTLWQSTPIWSQGEDFLAKYPKGLFGV